jgi:photosystem II stability/assembly factor-like uncharacterized protein
MNRSEARLFTAALDAWIRLLCAALLIASATTAQAGINVWTSHGPAGGGVTALAIDPVTPHTLYAGTGYGGVSKSTDAGTTWQVATLTDSRVIALAIDPITPSTLYAGTDNAGLFKSTDAGATWQAENAGLRFSPHALAIDPLTPSTLYAGTYFACGVFKSTNAGATWDCPPLDPADPIVSISALAIDPVTSRTVYAGARYGSVETFSPGLVLKSTDAGATWEAVSLGNYGWVTAVAIDPVAPRTLYAGMWSGDIFKSTDAGATWAAAKVGMAEEYVTDLAIDPVTPRTLYAGLGSDGVSKSTDAGATWQAENAGLPNTWTSALAVDPVTPSTLYAGTGGGVFSIQQVPPTPTSTATPTITATPSLKTADGGGCGIATSQRPDATGYRLALLAALAIIAARHRRSRNKALSV